MNAWALVALQAAPSVEPAATGLDAMRAIGALAAVMVALVVFLWLLKRGTFSALGRATRQGLAVESALALGDRRSLVVVSVEGRRLLLGLSPTQVSLITELRQRSADFAGALDGALVPPEGPRP